MSDIIEKATEKMTKYERTTFEDGDTDADAGSTASLEHAQPDVTFRTPKPKPKTLLSMWNEFSLLERILFVCTVLLLLTVLVLVLVIAYNRKTNYCLSPACVTIASSVLSSMDTTVDPCEDFFQYACGGWIKTHPIPDGNSRWNTFGVLWQENQLVMKNALEKPLNESHSEAERKAQRYYQSCMDKKKIIEKLKAKPLLDIIQKIGGWSVFGEWNESTFDFNVTLQTLSDYEIQPLFSVWVGPDDKQSTENIIQIDQSGLVLPSRDYYLKNDSKEVTDAYLKYMMTVATLMGADLNETQPLMQEILDLETEVANITVSMDERRDENTIYHRVTVSDLYDRAPAVDWLQYFQYMFGKAGVEDITMDENLVLYAPEFLQHVSDLILRTPARILNNYMIWKVAHRMAPFLNQDFRDASAEFAEALYGTNSKTDLWRFCVTDTDGSIGMALGAMFVREAFDGNSKQNAQQMINEIREAFKGNFPELDWMDDETRAAAREKADAVVDMIGFPNYILDPPSLDERYKGLEFNEDEYFENNLNLISFDIQHSREKLRKKVNRTKWEMTPPTVNAYYTPTKNEIVFPAGILQAPFYDKEYPKSLNFGGIGVVVGHELTHGFDDQGREYDKKGNLVPWWNNATVDKFKERTECMAEKYSQYTVNGEHVDGKQTLGENIADNGGLKAAFNAYDSWVEEKGPEAPLPALNLTHRQLFFLGFAQVWCSSSTQASSHLQLLSDPHSPAKYRVIGTLSNSEDFAKYYNCPTGSEMNPAKKCEVW
ncbi:endothelin-converting enzyme homolog isoform X2 [Ptychodera flava]|uniref:endothelin-converting enzyme homolog isoform X2 n=1 Tax=Ptychodera flava TaxID=63121 RepID=UPI00396A1C8C